MNELTEEKITQLVDAALAVRSRARAPYSEFLVGAAILDPEGRIHVGCNVENASYGLSVCAERHAVAAAVAAGACGVEALAVATGTSPPVSPCGACRQVLAEFGDFPIVLANPDGEQKITSVAELLPDAFGPEQQVKSQE